jgi:uncharacterized damage-inducible protein DinB
VRGYHEALKGNPVTRHDLQTLLEFHYWARDRMLDAVEPLTPEQFTRDLGNSFRSVRDTVAHIYGAEWVWYLRWQGTPPSALPPADQFPDVGVIRRSWSELEAKMRAFVDGLSDVDRVIDYTLFSGAAGSSSIWQMLQHVVNHATYHRGQVTTMLRQLGAGSCKSTDLIAFYRENPTVASSR